MSRNDFEYQGWVLRKVDESLQLGKFDCGDVPMNVYFRRRSKQFRRHLLIESYHFCPAEYHEAAPIVLVDLCNDAIRRGDITEPDDLTDHRKQFLQVFPAVKIARLGRDIHFKGRGISKHLFNALKLFFRQDNRTGCRFLTLDAYQSRVPLYEECGFIRTLAPEDEAGGDTVPMLFDLYSLAVPPEK